MMPILRSSHVSFHYSPDRPLLSDISLSIHEGQLLTLLGPNGVGKTTLLNCMCGLIRPISGEILLRDRELSRLSRREIACQIAYVPQKPAVSFDYSVLDFAVMGRTAHLSILDTPSSDDFDKARAALERLEIADLANRPISQLSGGEQQKVCIARALVQEPRLIILDEPTSALDYGNQIRVLQLVRELSKDGYAVVMTSHNPDHCLMLGGDVAILSRNGTLALGPAEEILTEERLKATYGTPIRMLYQPELGRYVCFPTGL